MSDNYLMSLVALAVVAFGFGQAFITVGMIGPGAGATVGGGFCTLALRYK